jgi:hypothetical protein
LLQGKLSVLLPTTPLDVAYALVTIFSSSRGSKHWSSFFGKVVGRGLVVGPTLSVLVEGETTIIKCFGRGFESLAWQHSIPGL